LRPPSAAACSSRAVHHDPGPAAAVLGGAHFVGQVQQEEHLRSLVSTIGSFIWSIADQLRGPYRPNQYGNVILPLTILRRLDCILEPDRDTVRALAATYDNPVELTICRRRKASNIRARSRRPSHRDWSGAAIRASTSGVEQLVDGTGTVLADLPKPSQVRFLPGAPVSPGDCRTITPA
jgi:hypothetical protein